MTTNETENYISNMIWIENVKDGIEVGSALKKMLQIKRTLN